MISENIFWGHFWWSQLWAHLSILLLVDLADLGWTISTKPSSELIWALISEPFLRLLTLNQSHKWCPELVSRTDRPPAKEMSKVNVFFVISYINIHLQNNINLSLCHEERRLHIAAVNLFLWIAKYKRNNICKHIFQNIKSTC